MRDLFKDKGLGNYKYVENYRYLGTIINSSVNANTHIDLIKPRLDAICRCLRIFRSKGNLKFNTNLFYLYILPQFRLLSQLYVLVRSHEKKKICILFKNYWKVMCCLPRSTPNEILKNFIGNPDEVLRNI